MKNILLYALLLFCALVPITTLSQEHPNVVFIYADDLGYGDLGCYGATKLQTPNIDMLARQGVRFTDAHSTSATCTPSRYALMTGKYPWRTKGTEILQGNGSLIIQPGTKTLPSVFKTAGYTTALVGKWHLGLGTEQGIDWNKEITPGPNELGFDYSFLFPATADRVPTVFVENHRVIALDSSDPIRVSYKEKVGNDPTGKEHPQLLKMYSSPGHGHDQTIVNGIGRIGYMTGGKKARWADEELSLTFLSKAKSFITQHKTTPFFLYFASTEPHVPRMPATMFKGASGLGYRGDAILQFDWTVGEIIKHLKQEGLDENTIIIFSSDNGPVLNDGYEDEAVSKLNGHKPAGALRGGKYSAFEAGTRIPFIVKWPGNKPSVSDALICQVDLLASFAAMFHQSLAPNDATDSYDMIDVLKGRSQQGRNILVEQGGALAVVKDGWKYIEPDNGPQLDSLVNIELGNNAKPQLYHLTEDIGETKNVADANPDKVKELSALLNEIKQKGRSR